MTRFWVAADTTPESRAEQKRARRDRGRLARMERAWRALGLDEPLPAHVLADAKPATEADWRKALHAVFRLGFLAGLADYSPKQQRRRAAASHKTASKRNDRYTDKFARLRVRHPEWSDARSAQWILSREAAPGLTARALLRRLRRRPDWRPRTK